MLVFPITRNFGALLRLLLRALPKSGAGRGVALPRNPSQIDHIFKNRAGHLPNTAQNRQMIEHLANHGKPLGTDRFGNTWAAQTLSDGRQVWVSYRNGVIQNGGINTTPRTFNSQTGLANPSG